MLPCKQLAAVSCAEGAHVRRPRRRYGPASDAEFLRSIADKTPGRGDADDGGARHMRHVYLKSYSLQLADNDDGGGASKKKKKKTIMDKTRRVVAHAVSKCRNKKPARTSGPDPTAARGGSSAAASSSSQPRRRQSDDAYGCRKAAKHVVSLMLSGLRACTRKPPSSS